MFGVREDYESVMTGANGQPRDGAGDCVVASPDIQTFPLSGIVTLAAILVTWIIVNSVASVLVHLKHHSSPRVAAKATVKYGLGSANKGLSNYSNACLKAIKMTVCQLGIVRQRFPGQRRIFKESS